ncbi:MAG: fused ferrous iron transport protein A/B [Syntrophomonadaceae bacterium]|nr:fused ferrous iron transport protein A/B [Syntrophomonadaceae bacterium]
MFGKKNTTKTRLRQGQKIIKQAAPPGMGSLNLTQIKNNGTARVVEVQGGHQVVGKLEAMGIVPGTVIVKKSASLLKGPIVIEKDGAQFAIGYAMAQGIMVESSAPGDKAVFFPKQKVVLIGNPNVGKSLVFSRITGKGVVTANYAGTTVNLVTDTFAYEGRSYELIDAPGIYSLEHFSEAEETALQLIKDCDIIINVVDVTNLERNLNLTLQLLQTGKPMVVCLNFWDDAAHNGITIDVQALENILGVPVVTVSALRNEGIAKLVEALDRAKVSQLQYNAEDHWKQVGHIIDKVQKLEHRHHTIWERLNDFTIHPIGGIITAMGVLLATLLIVRFLGEGIINSLLDPFYTDIYAPFIMNLVSRIPSEFIIGLLVGYSPDPMESFGILTSGLYIALVLVFPYFFSFYFVFGFLEDWGYLPRLSVLLDNIFHRLGLHGYSSIPIMLGLGCKVPAIMSTRLLNNRRDQILTIALIMMSAPCLPQTAMIISMGMNYGVPTVLFIFATLLILALAINSLINRILPGKSAEFLTELPSYRVPQIGLMARKLWVRIVEYFSEVFPMIAIGVLIMNILDYLKVIEFITNTLTRPVEFVLGLPPAIAPIMLLGFLRKDVSIALLAPLNLTAHQFIIASIFLVLYTPCISSFFTMLREMGTRTTLKIIGVVLVAAIAITALLHIIFTLLIR